MLTKLEPEFDIRFVEKSTSKAQSESQPIEKFPCVIGHAGNIKPLVLNGPISNYHCTVRYDIESRSYIIEDGADGKLSSNGLYFDDKKVESIVAIKSLGQRVYLLRVISGDEGYIEIYDAKKEAFCGRTTMDLDPRLVRTEATAVEAHSIATQNTENIKKIEGKLGTFFAFMEAISNNPIKTATAIALIAVMLCVGTPFFFLYAYRDQLMDAAIDRYKQSPGYQKSEQRN